MKVFALVDCNNFYASCERVFKPSLRDKPIVVLSNNDGCLVARSDEVKKLGIPMGAPYFKHKSELDRLGCTVCSSNYSLYGDMSARVMKILGEVCGDMEIYSIDEAFLSFDHVSENQLEDYGKNIKEIVYKCTGIPVSIGIARTKTMAKLANHIAKDNTRNGDGCYGGVFSFVDKGDDFIKDIYKEIDVSKVWGIGRQNSKKLYRKNVNTIYDLIHQQGDWVRKTLTIQGSRLVRELCGESSYKLDSNPDPKKGIASTRSFGKSVTTIQEMRQAVAMYCTRVGEKLRSEDLAASHIQVFVMTNRFKTNKFYDSIGYTFATQTNYTPDLMNAAGRCLDQIYVDGLLYKKAGVFVSGLVPQDKIRSSLFEKGVDLNKKGLAAAVVDKLNIKYGNGKVRLGTQGFNDRWKMNRNMVSPRYTTVWSDLLEV